MIGYGNPLREDDGFGPEVVARLRRRCPAGCRLFSVHQLTPEIVEKLVGCERLVFVDAALGEGEEGLAVPLEGSTPFSGLSHRMSPAVVVRILETLYAQRCEYLLFSCLTDHFGYCEGLSCGAEKTAERLSRYLAELCGSLNAEGCVTG